MKKLFATGLFGYCKKQVDHYLDSMKKDYENELYKKKERMMELSEENRSLKLEIDALAKRVNQLTEQEQYISRALVKAEQRAQSIIEDGQYKADEVLYQLKREKDQWRQKARDIRQELLTFEQAVLSMIERFRSDINYYAGKEISETLLMEEDGEERADKAVRKVV